MKIQPSKNTGDTLGALHGGRAPVSAPLKERPMPAPEVGGAAAAMDHSVGDAPQNKIPGGEASRQRAIKRRAKAD